MPNQNPLASTYQGPVINQWIDYNGHMSEAYYVLIFGFATDELYQRIGLGERYRSDYKCSAYTVEAHINYLQEVSEGEEVRVDTQLLALEGRKLRFCHTMTNTRSGEVLAFTELLALFMATEQSDIRVFPAQIEANINRLMESQKQPVPKLAQRQVGQSFR